MPCTLFAIMLSVSAMKHLLKYHKVMAIIKNGILGGVTGKVGNVVGASNRGVNYLRSVPTSFSDAKSPKQVSNRMKMKVCVSFLSKAKSFIRLGFRGWSKNGSAYNAAFSYNYGVALQGEYPDISLDYSKVMLSKGSLTSLYGTSAVALGADSLKLSWNDNTGEGSAKSGDTVMALVYAPELDEVVFRSNAGTRDAGEATVQVPQHFAGKVLHCWIAVMDPEKQYSASEAKESVSNSIYTGELTLA